jgi:hypothetical protein
MSNEYKDWERDKIIEETQIVLKYPFLRLRNLDGTIDSSSKFPMMNLEIPDGWYELFFQMCADIKPILEKAGLLDSFYFIQVKEKYNYLRCYYNKPVPVEVEQIITKYEQMAHYICTICGDPASYELQGYFASLCEGCWKDEFRYDKVEKIEFQPYFIINTNTKNVHFNEKKISFLDEWERYLEYLKNN